MDFKKIIQKLSLNDIPIGFGGCKNHGRSYDCCEYNLTVFDNKPQNDSVMELENRFFKIHHGSLNETHSNVLNQYDKMKIIQDDKWELRILLSQINEKHEKIFLDYAKDCLVECIFCVTKCKEGQKISDPFVSSWIKSATYFLADAISAYNLVRPSPTHMLEYFRGFEKNKVNEKFSVVNQCIGIERATPSLLSRMCKSTMGFSDMIEQNQHSKIIESKHNYLVENSLLTDCYYYLGYINRNNFIKIKSELHRKPDLIHVLRVAFDIENDPSTIDQQAKLLHGTANEILTFLNY